MEPARRDSLVERALPAGGDLLQLVLVRITGGDPPVEMGIESPVGRAALRRDQLVGDLHEVTRLRVRLVAPPDVEAGRFDFRCGLPDHEHLVRTAAGLEEYELDEQGIECVVDGSVPLPGIEGAAECGSLPGVGDQLEVGVLVCVGPAVGIPDTSGDDIHIHAVSLAGIEADTGSAGQIDVGRVVETLARPRPGHQQGPCAGVGLVSDAGSGLVIDVDRNGGGRARVDIDPRYLIDRPVRDDVKGVAL